MEEVLISKQIEIGIQIYMCMSEKAYTRQVYTLENFGPPRITSNLWFQATWVAITVVLFGEFRCSLYVFQGVTSHQQH